MTHHDSFMTHHQISSWSDFHPMTHPMTHRMRSSCDSTPENLFHEKEFTHFFVFCFVFGGAGIFLCAFT